MPKEIIVKLRLFNRYVLSESELANEDLKKIIVDNLKKSIIKDLNTTSNDKLMEAMEIDIRDWPL